MFKPPSLRYYVQQPLLMLLLSCVRLFVTPWTAARQTSLSLPISWSLLKFTSFELVILSNHLILCHPLLLLPSIFPSIRVFSNDLTVHIRWQPQRTNINSQIETQLCVTIRYIFFLLCCKICCYCLVGKWCMTLL